MKKFHIQSFHDKLIKFTLLFYWEIFFFYVFILSMQPKQETMVSLGWMTWQLQANTEKIITWIDRHAMICPKKDFIYLKYDAFNSAWFAGRQKLCKVKTGSQQ